MPNIAYMLQFYIGKEAEVLHDMFLFGIVPFNEKSLQIK